MQDDFNSLKSRGCFRLREGQSEGTEVGTAEKCTATSTQAQGGVSEAGRLGRSPRQPKNLDLTSR